LAPAQIDAIFLVMRKRFTAHQARAGKTAQEASPAGASKAGRPSAQPTPDKNEPGKAKETGGPSGPEPTRYGDWERKGICVDF
jgi:hypothetical protein